MTDGIGSTGRIGGMVGRLWGLCGVLVAAGCSGEGGEIHRFAVDLVGLDSDCTADAADYAEAFDYVVEYTGNDVVVSIGEDRLATGRADGCNLTYETVVWTDQRETGEIRWQLRGQAQAELGNDACGLDETLDWEGTEQFEVLSSTVDGVNPGCVFNVKVDGTYLGSGK